jgi:hypothetical protein
MEPESAGLMLMFMEKAQGMLTEQGSITNTEETITGDTAVVIVTFQDGSTEQYDLVRRDGKWLVTFDK